MGHNPPKRPVPLHYFGQAQRCGYDRFIMLCLNCCTARQRLISDVIERFDMMKLADYEARAVCPDCRMKMAYMVFPPDGARPGDSVKWWLR